MTTAPRSLLAGLAVAAALSGVAAAQPFPAPLIIGHRGAAGERPEHTLTGYRLAVTQGADFIEPDLVMTRDGVLIDRHENEIGATTDVAAHPEFAARKATKTIDGRQVTGWFSEDFTLAEIKTLRARERLPDLRRANSAYDGKDQVLTFQEVIDIARAEGAKAHRTVGIYAELKHPTYFVRAGLPMEEALVKVVKANGLDRRDAPFYFQCFELTPLRTVRGMMNVKTVFLMDAAGAPADLVAAGDARTYADLARPAQLAAMARFVDGIGPSTDLIVPRDAKGASLPPTTLVADAHAAGIVVHPFTFRAENYFLPLELRRAEAGKPAEPAAYGDLHSQLLQYFRLGVDGVFTDFPNLGVAAREDFLAGR
jgi:glycerophosphoryl diester phosphodiesterase